MDLLKWDKGKELRERLTLKNYQRESFGRLVRILERRVIEN